jgi:hypothetical protein
MGHYAKVEDGIVTEVIVAEGPGWCEENLGGEWIQTSYNTHGGVHSGGKFPIHKNYAGIGYTFDGIGFAPPQPFASWTLDPQTYLWQPPVPKPEGAFWDWNEEEQTWDNIDPTI